MNFDDINKIYEHMKTVVYPHVKTEWKDVSTEEVLIDKYLAVIDDNRKYKLLAMPFLVNTEKFLKEYKKNCIIFYNTPDPADGLMLFIHQISPSLHVHSKFFCWVENHKVHDYLACLLFHKDSKEAVDFMDKCYDLKQEGNTEDSEQKLGFLSNFENKL